MFSIWKTLNRYGTCISNFGANYKMVIFQILMEFAQNWCIGLSTA